MALSEHVYQQCENALVKVRVSIGGRPVTCATNSMAAPTAQNSDVGSSPRGGVEPATSAMTRASSSWVVLGPPRR